MKRKSTNKMEQQTRWKRAKNFHQGKNTSVEKRYLTLHGKKLATHIKSVFPSAIVYSDTRPFVVHIPNFMTDQECKEKLAEISPTFNDKCEISPTGSRESNTKNVIDTMLRKSKSVDTLWSNFTSKFDDMFLKKEDDKIIFQVPIFIRYQHQGFVASHTDLVSSYTDAQRRYTAILYLNDVPESNGGATEFKGVVDSTTGHSLKIQPKRGDLVFFRVSMLHPYQDKCEIPDEDAIHRGCEFRETLDCPEKWICQLFILDKYIVEPTDIIIDL